MPGEFHRRSIRLPGFDYRAGGAYFITVCTIHRLRLFGDVLDGEMLLNWRGRIVGGCWEDVPAHHAHVQLDAFVVMPNHIHGILVVAPVGGGTAGRAPTRESFGKSVAGSLATIIRSFKSAATKRINEVAGIPGAPLWQSNYYEHVIRDEAGLNRIRSYIGTNPASWPLDKENPRHQGEDEFDRWLASLPRGPGGAKNRAPGFDSNAEKSPLEGVYIRSEPAGSERRALRAVQHRQFFVDPEMASAYWRTPCA